MCDFVPCYSNLNLMLQDLKYEESSVKAVQCLNDMVTNALLHAEDCLKYMSALRDMSIFRFCAIPQVLFFFSLIAVMFLFSCNDIISFINKFIA